MSLPCEPPPPQCTPALTIERPLDPGPVVSLEDFSLLVEFIYRGPLESPPWKTFLETLWTHLSASFTTLILRPAAPANPSLTVLAGPSTVESIDLYNSRFFQLDPFVSLPRDEVVVASEILGDRRWLDSVFYREYLQPLDILHVMGVDLVPSHEGEDCRLRVTRSHAKPSFSERDKAFCRLILPHLKRSVQLSSYMDHIDIERKLFATTIERLQVGTVTLDDKGAILSVNCEAQAILDKKDGIRLAGGALQADYAEENAMLQKHMAAALSGTFSGTPSVVEAISITRPSGRSKLRVLVRFIPAGEWSDAWHRPKVAIFLRDPEQKAQGSLDVIRRLFDLTHAEAWLALLLANGLTLDEAAAQLNIRRNTARAHLRAVFSKTAVTRQTELVRLVLNSVSALS